jgi:hypothetical protein
MANEQTQRDYASEVQQRIERQDAARQHAASWLTRLLSDPIQAGGPGTGAPAITREYRLASGNLTEVTVRTKEGVTLTFSIQASGD